VLRLAVERLAVLRLAVLRFAVLRLAVLRLAVLRFAVERFAVLRLAVERLAVLRLAVLRFAVVRFAVLRLAVERLAVERLAVLRLAVERFAVERFAVARRPDERFAPDLFCGVAILPPPSRGTFAWQRHEQYVVCVGCFQHIRPTSSVCWVANCPRFAGCKRVNTNARAIARALSVVAASDGATCSYDLRAVARPPLRPAAFFCAVVPPCDELLRELDECDFFPPRDDDPGEFAIFAARSFDIPFSFNFSYCFSFLT
jgi:hypothetical protein